METECVLSLGDQRWTLPPGTDTITLGRASNADIRLQADDQISRIHARLTRSGDTWILHDESRNGTGLNGHRLTAPTPLTPGDRIHIGRSILTFQTPTAPAYGAPDTPPTESTESTRATPTTPPTGAPAAAPAESGRSEPRRSEPPGSGPAPSAPAGSAPAPAAHSSESPPSTFQAPPDQPDAAAPAAPALPTEQLPREPAQQHPDLAPGVVVDGYAGAEEGVDYGPAGLVPGFEVGRGGDAGPWAAYPSADNPEPVRSPSEISAQIDQSDANWNPPDTYADLDRRPANRRTANPTPDGRTAASDRLPTGDRRTAASTRLPAGDRRTAATTGLPTDDRRTAEPDRDDVVGTVRLARVLLAAGAVIFLGLIVNLIVTFLSDGPDGALRWLVPPGIALVVAMVLALLDAAAPNPHRPGRFDVSVLIAIAVVLVGIGVGGFAVTAGAEYVAGYLTGNESGADRLVKPVAKTEPPITMTVENVTYTSHFTRIKVLVANGGKEAFSIPIAGTTFTAADGTALHADAGKSSWPSRITPGGSEHGTITFKGRLPDSATSAVLTFTSGGTSFTITGVQLSK